MAAAKPTLLETLVRDQVHNSTVATFSRTIDRIADSYAEEILRDPVFKAEMIALIRQAVAAAMKAFNEPDPNAP